MPELTLADWLGGFELRSAKLEGLSAHQLLAKYREDLEPWARRVGERWEFGIGTAQEAWMILHAMETLPRYQSWIRSFDYMDAEAWSSLPSMVGLSHRDVPPQPDRYPGDYLFDACNELTKTGEHIFSLTTHGDNYVVIAMPPRDLELLVQDGYLEVDRRRDEDSPPPSLRDKVLAWLRRG
jgi:hypothetical protein